jgi:hypothetical protein
VAAAGVGVGVGVAVAGVGVGVAAVDAVVPPETEFALKAFTSDCAA